MGRRRRNAYWSSAGGSAQVADTANSSQMNISANESTTVAVEQPSYITRRSLRQQAKKAQTGPISLAESEVDIEGSDDEFARFTPLTTPARKKRFLKDTHPGGRKKEDVSESTATVLNRLINKRGSKPGYVVKSGRFNMHKNKGAGGRNIAPKYLPKKGPPSFTAATSSYTGQPQLQHDMSMPLKVEIQEGHGYVPLGAPRKRGRKRKVDLPVNLSMKKESDEGVPGQHQQQKRDPDWDPNVTNNRHSQAKRGRQSTATANVKNRFPFCSLCLSKTPPSDYIINYMSCPNEYQRMKRLFSYIYKDLKFPFMPFDLERENVFDYCDIPLCDCCIQLYREMYESYAQIETSRDQLKSKIERMVYQIQLSEQNPAVAQQLSSIKNSPDALMNKYCNFRRRFSSYRPGDSRGDVQGASLVPATIARIKVINQTPKRTAGTQTFLTAGHFPPPPPPTTTETPKATESTSKPDTTAGVTNAPGGSNDNGDGKVVVKKEVIEPESSKPTSITSTVNNSSSSSTISKPSKSEPPQKQIPKSTPPPQASKGISMPKAEQMQAPKTLTPSAKPVSKPPPHASVLTIIKTPGGGGPAIIRKLPPKPCIIGQPAKLLAIATPTHRTQTSKTIANANVKVNGSAEKTPQAASSKTGPVKQNSAVVSTVVKSEPVEAEETARPTEEESDPFFSSGPLTQVEKVASSSEEKVEEKKSDKDTAASENQESKSSSQSDTNVFHKHKKLRVLPVPSYSSKESSNDSSDNNMTNNDEEEKTKGDLDRGKDNDQSEKSSEKKETEQPSAETEENVQSKEDTTSSEPHSSSSPKDKSDN